MGTLSNVPLASAHEYHTVAALSWIQWRAHHMLSCVACRHRTNKYTKINTNISDDGLMDRGLKWSRQQ